MPFGKNGYGNFSPADSRNVNFAVQDDADIALLVKYIGTSESGTVEINAGGDLLFKTGVIGSEAADTTVLESGGTGGTIDVSDANGNTMGEVVDAINASANWEAVLIDALRSDLATDTLLDAGPSQARVPEGLKVNWDTSVAGFNLTQLIAPDYIREDIRSYAVNGSVSPMYPFVGTRAAVDNLQGLSTFASGTSTFQLISDNGIGTSTIFYSKAAGATTVETEPISNTDAPLVGSRSERVLARLNNSAAAASATLRGSGRLYRSLA